MGAVEMILTWTVLRSPKTHARMGMDTAAANQMHYRLFQLCLFVICGIVMKAASPGSHRAFQGKVEDLTTEATAYGQEEPK